MVAEDKLEIVEPISGTMLASRTDFNRIKQEYVEFFQKLNDARREIKQEIQFYST